MKVYLSPYRDHWVSPYTIIRLVCFWRVLTTDRDGDEVWQDEPWAEQLSDRLEPLCKLWQRFADWAHPPVNYVKIDHYDTWSMDHSLAHIIVPMLKQLKATKHGSPSTELEDIPEHLHPKVPPSAANNWDDETVHLRWNWVMDEMIWAFEQKINDDSESKFYDHSQVQPGANLNQQINQMKVDRAGLEAHQARMANGFRLFGKYYQGLWD